MVIITKTLKITLISILTLLMVLSAIGLFLSFKPQKKILAKETQSVSSLNVSPADPDLNDVYISLTRGVEFSYYNPSNVLKITSNKRIGTFYSLDVYFVERSSLSFEERQKYMISNSYTNSSLNSLINKSNFLCSADYNSYNYDMWQEYIFDNEGVNHFEKGDLFYEVGFGIDVVTIANFDWDNIFVYAVASPLEGSNVKYISNFIPNTLSIEDTISENKLYTSTLTNDELLKVSIPTGEIKTFYFYLSEDLFFSVRSCVNVQPHLNQFEIKFYNNNFNYTVPLSSVLPVSIRSTYTTYYVDHMDIVFDKKNNRILCTYSGGQVDELLTYGNPKYFPYTLPSEFKTDLDIAVDKTAPVNFNIVGTSIVWFCNDISQIEKYTIFYYTGNVYYPIDKIDLPANVSSYNIANLPLVVNDGSVWINFVVNYKSGFSVQESFNFKGTQYKLEYIGVEGVKTYNEFVLDGAEFRLPYAPPEPPAGFTFLSWQTLDVGIYRAEYDINFNKVLQLDVIGSLNSSGGSELIFKHWSSVSAKYKKLNIYFQTKNNLIHTQNFGLGDADVNGWHTIDNIQVPPTAHPLHWILRNGYGNYIFELEETVGYGTAGKKDCIFNYNNPLSNAPKNALRDANGYPLYVTEGGFIINSNNEILYDKDGMLYQYKTASTNGVSVYNVNAFNNNITNIINSAGVYLTYNTENFRLNDDGSYKIRSIKITDALYLLTLNDGKKVPAVRTEVNLFLAFFTQQYYDYYDLNGHLIKSSEYTRPKIGVFLAGKEVRAIYIGTVGDWILAQEKQPLTDDEKPALDENNNELLDDRMNVIRIANGQLVDFMGWALISSDAYPCYVSDGKYYTFDGTELTKNSQNQLVDSTGKVIHSVVTNIETGIDLYFIVLKYRSLQMPAIAKLVDIDNHTYAFYDLNDNLIPAELYYNPTIDLINREINHPEEFPENLTLWQKIAQWFSDAWYWIKWALIGIVAVIVFIIIIKIIKKARG